MLTWPAWVADSVGLLPQLTVVSVYPRKGSVAPSATRMRVSSRPSRSVKTVRSALVLVPFCSPGVGRPPEALSASVFEFILASPPWLARPPQTDAIFIGLHSPDNRPPGAVQPEPSAACCESALASTTYLQPGNDKSCSQYDLDCSGEPFSIPSKEFCVLAPRLCVVRVPVFP